MTVLVYPRAMRHVDLDPVGAVIELLSRGFAGFHGPVDDLRAFGHVEFGSVAFEVVPAGGGDCAGGAEETRAGGGAFGGGFAPEEDVRVGVDESGEDCGVGEIDAVEAGGRLGGRGRDFNDPVVLDEDELVFERGGGGAVDEGAGADDGLGILALGWLRECDQRGAEEYRGEF